MSRQVFWSMWSHQWCTELCLSPSTIDSGQGACCWWLLNSLTLCYTVNRHCDWNDLIFLVISKKFWSMTKKNRAIVWYHTGWVLKGVLHSLFDGSILTYVIINGAAFWKSAACMSYMCFVVGDEKWKVKKSNMAF